MVAVCFLFFKDDNKMKLIAILRIKDAIRTVDECLRKLSEFCDEIIVLDNGSTDGTLERYSAYPKIKTILQIEGYHGGRDVNLLLEAAKKKNPDWILKIDSDEIFERHFNRKVIEKYMRSKYDRINFRMYNFWLSKKYFRVDRSWFRYTLGPQRELWRNLPDTYFMNIKVHYGNIQGISGSIFTSPYRIKHYGHADVSEAKVKFEFYRKIDDTGRLYEDENPDLSGVIRLPFIEFRNRFINDLFIHMNSQISKVLLALLNFKRKFFRGIRLFR